MEQDPAGSHDVLYDHNAIVLFTGNNDGRVWNIGPIPKSGNSGGSSGKLSIVLTCLLETVAVIPYVWTSEFGRCTILLRVNEKELNGNT
jgi:hypothetical protein